MEYQANGANNNSIIIIPTLISWYILYEWPYVLELFSIKDMEIRNF